MKKIILLFTLTIQITLIFADDTNLGSQGGNVFPIMRNKYIRMAKEDVKVKMLKDSCIVTCLFWFKNYSREKQYVFMGFPDYFECVGEDSESLRHFTCQINNKKTEVRPLSQKITEELDTAEVNYERWYCWDTNFKPNETLLIWNTYVANWGGSADGTLLISYLIGTGRTWHETIGDGKITFDFSDLVSQSFVDTTGYGTHKLSPGMTRQVYNDSIVYSFKNYYPDWGEQYSVSLLPFWKYYAYNDTISTNPYKEGRGEFSFEYKYTKPTLRLMRNEVYARHGYIFKDEALNTYFRKFKWYKPNPKFEMNQLKKFELYFIDYIKGLEEKK
ncbi:YARHG domain-containing protein [Parabacteroides sp. FAFU027]|uniref:YARHG domain-containing protein n=1 Tax=Parabacteroides sp. FAFU027 TaxID=2922715 RepID=UPI001FAF2717|nr:YARHG domain-containing protein [Parabacteroides sp. FAFU027]